MHTGVLCWFATVDFILSVCSINWKKKQCHTVAKHKPAPSQKILLWRDHHLFSRSYGCRQYLRNWTNPVLKTGISRCETAQVQRARVTIAHKKPVINAASYVHLTNTHTHVHASCLVLHIRAENELHTASQCTLYCPKVAAKDIRTKFGARWTLTLAHHTICHDITRCGIKAKCKHPLVARSEVKYIPLSSHLGRCHHYSNRKHCYHPQDRTPEVPGLLCNNTISNFCTLQLSQVRADGHTHTRRHTIAMHQFICCRITRPFSSSSSSLFR